MPSLTEPTLSISVQPLQLSLSRGGTRDVSYVEGLSDQCIESHRLVSSITASISASPRYRPLLVADFCADLSASVIRPNVARVTVVAAPVIGTTNLANVKDIIERLKVKLTDEEINTPRSPTDPRRLSASNYVGAEHAQAAASRILCSIVLMYLAASPNWSPG
ncbi:hypothetical protein A0H81_09819 [Grifola frondosa]|uniref:Uncharacterized protein n=1 Tax=Grifola frondosa TaxID=5627 RepID=A0A1C7M1B0_GRIFR|nr:hypothetical protein A0H81_09819 [Grifola frondosa]